MIWAINANLGKDQHCVKLSWPESLPKLQIRCKHILRRTLLIHHLNSFHLFYAAHMENILLKISQKCFTSTKKQNQNFLSRYTTYFTAASSHIEHFLHYYFISLFYLQPMYQSAALLRQRYFKMEDTTLYR